LRRSLGFVVCYEAYALKQLRQYTQAEGLSWPMRSQTVLDWIAAAMHCGPAGQRARLIHARGFLRHLKAGFLGGAQSYPPIPAAECFLPVWPRTAFVVHDAASDFHDAASDFRADSWCGRRKEKRWTARTLLTFVPARICCRTPAGVVPSGHECQFLVATLVCLFGSPQ